MKKNILSITMIVFIILITVFILILVFDLVKLNSVDSGIVVFKYGEMNISATLSENEIKELIEILNGKISSKLIGEPACGFNKDISIIFDGKYIFCIAQDNCPVVYCMNQEKYISLSENENRRFRNIMSKYGAIFPCV